MGIKGLVGFSRCKATHAQLSELSNTAPLRRSKEINVMIKAATNPSMVNYAMDPFFAAQSQIFLVRN